MILKKVVFLFWRLAVSADKKANKMNRLASNFLLASKKNTRLTLSVIIDSISFETILRWRNVSFLFLIRPCEAPSFFSTEMSEDLKIFELYTTTGRINKRAIAIKNRHEEFRPILAFM